MNHVKVVYAYDFILLGMINEKNCTEFGIYPSRLIKSVFHEYKITATKYECLTKLLCFIWLHLVILYLWAFLAGCQDLGYRFGQINANNCNKSKITYFQWCIHICFSTIPEGHFQNYKLNSFFC